MNLLNGFKVRSENDKRRYVLQELDNLAFSGSDLSGEPGLTEMLVDPVVLTMMLRDGVGTDEIAELFKSRDRIAA